MSIDVMVAGNGGGQLFSGRLKELWAKAHNTYSAIINYASGKDKIPKAQGIPVIPNGDVADNLARDYSRAFYECLIIEAKRRAMLDGRNRFSVLDIDPVGACNFVSETIQKTLRECSKSDEKERSLFSLKGKKAVYDYTALFSIRLHNEAQKVAMSEGKTTATEENARQGSKKDNQII